MSEAKTNQKRTDIEKRIITISSKRQITIPAKFYKALALDNELECIYSEGMLILKPIVKEDSAFSEEILGDLIQKGYSGQKLLDEFKKVNRAIRPAVEKLIEEADRIAENTSSNYIDHTDAIFSDVGTED